MNYIFLFCFFSQFAFSHGENKPGPHGGHIRMPGAFHTELLLDQQIVKVYLLDMSFKNPMTTNSTVGLKILSGESSQDISCEKKSNFFECRLPVTDKIKEIRVKAARAGSAGKEAIYPFPLAVLKINVPAAVEDHSQHDH